MNLNILGLTVTALLLGACGEMVEIPPASKGMIMHKAGYEGDFISPSRFRLDVCMREPCQKLVLISVSDQALTESVDVFLPLSNLLLEDLEVNLVVSISNDEKALRRVLDRVSPQQIGDTAHKRVTFDSIYRIYAKERIRAIVREAVAARKLEWLLANREAYAGEVFATVERNLSQLNAPIILKQLSFARLNPPDVITNAWKKAEERKIALAQAEANKLVDIKEAEAALEVEEKKKAVRLLRAQAFAEEASTMALAITPEWLAMRRMEVMELMAENKSSVFFPVDMGVEMAVTLETLQELKNVTTTLNNSTSK